MTGYIDYYSKGYVTKSVAEQYVIDLREAGVEAVTDVFQIFAQTGIDPETMEPVFESIDGKWYFNVRSSQPLAGDWIGPEPDTPAQVWA